jgi:hypothetical protein
MTACHWANTPSRPSCIATTHMSPKHKYQLRGADTGSSLGLMRGWHAHRWTTQSAHTQLPSPPHYTWRNGIAVCNSAAIVSSDFGCALCRPAGDSAPTRSCVTAILMNASTERSISYPLSRYFGDLWSITRNMFPRVLESLGFPQLRFVRAIWIIDAAPCRAMAWVNASHQRAPTASHSL